MITVSKLSKSYGDKRVLDNVSFTIGKGEIYGLIGKNGAGKTTLMNIIANIISYDSGELELCKENGESVRIGYLPDLPAFFEYMTASEYLNFLMMNSNDARTEELLNMVGLSGDVRIGGMSRGMRQRLGIAATLVGNPDLILLDEPTSALDPQGRIEVMEILGKLKEQGKSVLLSTHILADMEKVCDRVGFLNEGKLVKDVEITELRGSMSSIVITFATTPDEAFFGNMTNVMCTRLEGNVLRMDAVGGNIEGAQRELFGKLSAYNNPVIDLSLKMSDLDSMFQEVCL